MKTDCPPVDVDETLDTSLAVAAGLSKVVVFFFFFFYENDQVGHPPN